MLKGYDHHHNVVLVDAVERVFSPAAGVENVALGLYVIRGHNL